MESDVFRRPEATQTVNPQSHIIQVLQRQIPCATFALLLTEMPGWRNW